MSVIYYEDICEDDGKGDKSPFIRRLNEIEESDIPMKEYGILCNGELLPEVHNNIEETKHRVYILKHLIGYGNVLIVEIVKCNAEGSIPASAGKEQR